MKIIYLKIISSKLTSEFCQNSDLSVTLKFSFSFSGAITATIVEVGGNIEATDLDYVSTLVFPSGALDNETYYITITPSDDAVNRLINLGTGANWGEVGSGGAWCTHI